MPLHSLYLLALAATPHSFSGDAPLAQFVRIEIYGEERMLSLAEVEVFSEKVNVATAGVATQSTTYQSSGADKAIDGILDGVHSAGSVSHTADGQTDPWWEVDLGALLPISQVTVWNRVDCCAERLADYTLILLDEDRKEVERFGPNPAPPLYRDHLFEGVEPRRSKAALARSHQLQTKINASINLGVEYLQRTQHRDGSWRGHHDRHRNGLTALCAYSLVKSGIEKDDPCILRALNWLKQIPCDDTYSAGCLLMLLAAVEDEEHLEWAEEITDFLIDIQGSGGSDGLWAYPASSWDFSNSQYAALGLRAASLMGVRIPSKVWERMIENTLDMQVPPQVIPPPPGSEGRTGSGHRIAPFCYRAPDDNGGTGSMTTAGIGCLVIASQALGTRGTGNPRIQRSIQHALNWLTVNFTVTKSPGGGRHRYYLYGLERVGGLLDIKYIGPYDWYEAGATNLTRSQGGGGAWSNSETETCYALLFLNKATASSTGGNELNPSKLSHAAEGDETEVWLRGSGDSPLTLWLSGFPDWVLEEFTPADELVPEIARGLRLVRIEYSINDEIVARIPGDPTRAWRGERYAYRHPFKTRGEYKVTARAFVLGPEAMPGDADGIKEIVSSSFTVPVEGLFEDWMLEYSEAGSNNMLSTVDVSAKVSSERNRGKHENLQKQEEALAKEAAATIDGFEHSHWLCAPDDAHPSLTVRLARPIRAQRLLLSPAGSNLVELKSFDKILRASVTINGKDDEPYEVTFPKDSFQKGILELKKAVKIRSFKVEILERVKQDRNHGMAGFSEVSLER